MNRTQPVGRPPAFELSALAHPAWWVALLVLLVNDNLLKGHGVIPGWLTGKLSDFAFVVVAPTLFAAMLPRALPGRRTLALTSVIGLYVATDLSPAASDAFVAVMARLGLAARLWPDVTDLLALALLPLTVHLLRLESPPLESRARFTLARIGVMVGAAACLATSAPPSYEHHPFLFNATPAAKTVRLTWVLRQVPCEAPETVAATLGPSDLDDPLTLGLDSGQVAALDGLPAKDVSPVGVCEASALTPYAYADPSFSWCVGAILEADGAAPVLLVATPSWRESDGGAFFSCQNPPSPVSRCKPQSPPTYDPGPDAVSLGVVDGQLRFVIGKPGRRPTTTPAGGRDESAPSPPTVAPPKVRIGPIDPAAVAARAPSADGCRALREAYETLSASATCASNLDCLGRKAPPIPTTTAACDIAVNVGAASMIEELNEKWLASCQPVYQTTCYGGYAQPAVCREGQCASVCPGVVLPACAAACTSLQTPADGDECGTTYFPPCRRPDGATCACDVNRTKCTAASTAGSCPLACIEPPGGGTFQPP